MSGEKTEKATPKKIKDLRKKGSAARSMDLQSGVSLVALAAVLPWMTGRLWSALHTDMAVVLVNADVDDIGGAKALAGRVVLDAARAVAPAIAIVGIAAIIAGSLVTWSKPNPAMLKPHWDRLSPKKALKQMLGSSHSPVELLRSTVKLTLLTVVAVGSWQKGYAELLSSGGEINALTAIVGTATSDVIWRTALLALVVGLADAAYQRRMFGKQARMSVQDVREEHKQADGNPEMKGAIRSRQLAAARSRMIEAVPKADVVLANPTHLVIALAYTDGSPAPVVVAKGAGGAADRIKAVAAEHGVPIISDKPLARALYKATEVGDVIPAEMFRVVAELLAVIYAARRRGSQPVWTGSAA